MLGVDGAGVVAKLAYGACLVVDAEGLVGVRVHIDHGKDVKVTLSEAMPSAF